MAQGFNEGTHSPTHNHLDVFPLAVASLTFERGLLVSNVGKLCLKRLSVGGPWDVYVGGFSVDGFLYVVLGFLRD